MIPTLALLRVLAVAGAVAVLFTPRRRLLLIAAAWSLAMILPALPLVRHFLPYYLFAPLFGFALAMGTALDWLYEIGRKRLSSAAIAVPWAVLVLWILINASTARRLIREHPLLQKPTPAEAMHGLSLRPPTVPVVSFSALRIVSLP